MNYCFATIEDMDLLVSRRLQFIEINEDCENYDSIKENCYLYFKKSFANDSCDVVLAEEGGMIVGTGIVFYYDSVPSRSNPRGKNAYVTSLYVEPKYRKRGIARAIMTELTSKAASRGYEIIMLNASDMGRPLYEKMGFTEIHNGMIWDMSKRKTED
ncbi:MAG: GNAT family N-acetyltransferase [Lachnospiraceae bacterium]|nr:GNAT family N-acetyltransferase [Lachnospiraceae bacterium]